VFRRCVWCLAWSRQAWPQACVCMQAAAQAEEDAVEAVAAAKRMATHAALRSLYRTAVRACVARPCLKQVQSALRVKNQQWRAWSPHVHPYLLLRGIGMLGCRTCSCPNTATTVCLLLLWVTHTLLTSLLTHAACSHCSA